MSRENKAKVFGDTVVFVDKQGISRSLSVGDVVLIWVSDRFSSDGKATQFVKVAMISNGNDAGDPGDFGFYYRDEHGAPAQDFERPENVIEIYRKTRPGTSPAGPGLSGNAPGLNDRSST